MSSRDRVLESKKMSAFIKFNATEGVIYEEVTPRTTFQELKAFKTKLRLMVSANISSMKSSLRADLNNSQSNSGRNLKSVRFPETIDKS